MFHQQVFYPHQQTSGNHRVFPPNQQFFYRSNGPIPTHSTHDFERFPPASNHGFTTMPSGGYPFFDQQRWRPNLNRPQQVHHRRTPAFQFQDKSTSYFMTDPIKTSDDRIAIQLTKVHIGPNGDQQRVFVEQEFSNEKELKKFVRNLRENFEKTFNNRSSGEYTRSDDSSSTDSKKSGVVVVEEPDEEPKVYEQQAYNANIEFKQATASVLTPPSSPPPMQSAASSSASIKTDQTQKKQTTPPPISHMSSTSTTRSNHHRHQRNKTKYRRQKDEQKASHIFQMPSFSRQYQATPTPPRFQQRFFHPNHDFHPPPPPPQNPNFQWRLNPNNYPKTRSRSYVPPMADQHQHIPRPPPTPARFQNLTDPFFRPIPPTRFAPPPPPRHRNFHIPSPSPGKFRRSNRRRGGPPQQPSTITENYIYPNNVQQQPRVQRTKSECRNIRDNHQRQKSQNTTRQFQQFSPLQPPPTIQRHFIPFRSAPVFLTSMHSTAPIFYPNQRRQYPHAQTQFRLVNHFHLGTNRF